MRFFPHTNLFDCLSPMLEENEEEVFFKHPEYDFYCNQLGSLYFPEELKAQTRRNGQYKILDVKTKMYIVLGVKGRVVRECYDGFSYKAYSFYHADGNPYNFTSDNVVAVKKSHKDNSKYRKEFRSFVIETLKHMNSREPYILKRGLDPFDYWEALQLPDWVMKEYRLYKGKPLPPTDGIKKKYLKGDDQMVVLKQIYDMKQAGNSWNVMMDVLGIRSRAGFCYLLKKAESTFDI